MASEEKVESTGTTSSAEVVVPVPAAVPTKKRGKPIVSNPLDAVTAAALSTAIHHMSTAGYHGLATLLVTSLQEAQQSIIPAVELVKQAAKKAVTDQPVWVHWSKLDMAPQFKVDSSRLSLTGALRGYRMARASHGVATGSYYFECILHAPPSATEILNSLPPNARLGPGLRKQLQEAVEWEEKQAGSHVPNSTEEGNPTKKRKVEDAPPPPPQVGGHVRIGWSMRTGDLQAPVGYDKWSYGIRNIGGSILHCSQRQDTWGGEGFGANDVIGCAICFDENDDENKNHVRFFKNGDCMGQFVISKGKREGGEAFSHIERGTYYPAVSCYMGGAVRANFGPHWVCPPKRSRLPAGLKNLKPLSSVSPPPVSPEEALNNCAATSKLFRKPEHQQALKDAVQAEAEIQCQVYADFLKNHVKEIRQARIERGLSVADLPEEEAEQEMMNE
jgi:SPRY domain